MFEQTYFSYAVKTIQNKISTLKKTAAN